MEVKKTMTERKCDRTVENIDGAERHVYTVAKSGRRIDRSVTAYISRTFFGEFDGKTVAEKMVSSAGWSRNKYKMEIDRRCTAIAPEAPKNKQLCATALLDVWRETREKGVDLHAYIENILQRQLHSEHKIDRSIAFEKLDVDHFNLSPSSIAVNVSMADRIAVNCCLKYITNDLKWSPWAFELTIYDEDANLAGTVDAIFWNSNTKSWILLDWKRSKVNALAFKSIELDRAMSSYGNSPYWRYAFQLNLYKLILEHKYGFERVDTYIVAFPPDSGTFEILGVPDILHLHDHYRQLIAEEREKKSQENGNLL